MEGTHVVLTGDCSSILKQFHLQQVTLCRTTDGKVIKGVSGNTRMYALASGRAVYLTDDQVRAM